MNLLLVAATEFEIAPFKDYLIQQYKQIDAHRFFNEKNHVEILITGIGMVATTFQLTQRLTEKKYDLVLQAGIAGSYDASLVLGEVVAVEADIFGDLGAEDHYDFLDVFDLDFEEKNTFPFQQKRLVNPMNNMPLDYNLKKVSALTVNSVSGAAFTIEKRRKKYNCQLESMEGVAFHYVCLVKNCPFLQVRSVSNYVEPRDKSKWKIKEAIENLNRWLVGFIQ